MPALPPLDGVVFRSFDGPSDYPHIARIISAAYVAEGTAWVETAEGVASNYDNLVRCDVHRDFLVAEVRGVPIAFSRVSWDPEEDDLHVYRHVCFVDPAHGGRGVGSALFAWNEERLREIAEEHAAGSKVLEAMVKDVNAGATALVRGAGYEAVKYDAEMVRPSVGDLPDHPLPDGVEIRPVAEEHMRPIWDAHVEAFREHWGFVEPGEPGYERFLAFPYNDPTLWKVAWDDEGVAGQVRSFINTAHNEAQGFRRGWTEDISTGRRWRRRGLAKALIVESIRELAARGMEEVALGVHTENLSGALDLYAGLGYEVAAVWTTYRKPL